MKCYVSLLVCTLLLLMIAACGGEGPNIITRTNKGGGSERKDTLEEWRAEEERFAGGTFEFGLDEEQFKTRWGYAEFARHPTEESSLLVLLTSPKGKNSEEDFPKLRLFVRAAGVVKPEDLQGKTIAAERFTLRKNKDVNKDDVIKKGNIEVNIREVGEFITGEFNGEVTEKENTVTIKGSFSARLNVYKAKEQS